MKRSLILFFALILCSSSAIASTTNPMAFGTKGKIAGTVVDEFGETLVGVQVVIEGTTKGTTTDLDGKYTLVNLDPGTYTLLFRYIGFATLRVERVEVIVDRTTTIDATLQEEVIEGQEVIITAERPIVEKDRTTTTAFISSEQLEALPLTSISEAIDQQAGVVDGHFRGGRTAEVAYLVNGVPINNAFSNEASFDVEQNMVSSLEVISGVFNAEYGQALSGVVNIVTKGVSNEWSGNFLGYVGTIVSNRELEFVTRNTDQTSFLGVNDFSSETYSYTEASSTFQDQDVQLSIGGPLIKNKLGIQGTVRYVNTPGHLIGRDLFRPSDVQSGVSGSGDPSTWLINASGTGDFYEMNNQERISVNASLVYELTSRAKLDYNLFFQDGDGRGYNHAYKYNPFGTNKYYFQNQTHILGFRYTIGDNSFANVSYSFLNDVDDNYLYDDSDATGVLDDRYVNETFAQQQGQDAFNMGGNDLFSSQNKSQTHTIVADYTSQLNNIVLWKSGVSARFHSLENESYGILVTADDTAIRGNVENENNLLDVNPWEAAGYSQVKLEFDDLIVNAGLRFDYFEPNYVVPIDIANAYLEEIPDPDNPGEVISNRTDADPTFQLSPRLGVAFPISETGVMRFSAGLFFQTPQLSLLYSNNEFDRDVGSQQISYGNANLEPERTLQFEVGLQQGLTETLGLDLTVFSKDIRELAGNEALRATTGQFTSQLRNIDYGTVKGVTLSLYQRGGDMPVSWTIDYTLQYASGSASDANERFNRLVNGSDDIISINRLNWDRRHVLNNSITWVSKFGLTTSMINSLQSGNPYTTNRDFIQSNVPNNEDAPAWFNSDVRLYYKPPALAQDIELFVQIDNIFDTNPHFWIYNDTGLADESSELQRRLEGGGQPGGLNTYEEWYLSEERRGVPRQVKIGLSYNF